MRKSIHGLSLIELLVSMVISGIILAGVVNVVVSSKVTFIAEEENSFIQENARYVMETLTRDARMAGSMGCASLSTALIGNVISDNTEGGILNLTALEGFEGGVDSYPDSYKSDAQGRASDSVIFRYADESTAVETGTHQLGPDKINTSSKTNLSWDKDDALIIVDSNCRSLSLFRVTSDTSSGKHIFHKSNGSSGNCTSVLRATVASFDCSSTPCSSSNCGGNPQSEFPEGSKVMQFAANAYYIGDSNLIEGMPALKRVTVKSSSTRTDELAQGVEAMDILYGEDMNDDGNIQKFVTANNVTDWSNVLAVRFYLTFRSQTQFYDSNYEITLNGVDYNDRYLRQIANLTVRLRNQ